MNEIGYRVSQRYKWALLAGMILFGGMFLLCLVVAIGEEPGVALLSLLFAILSLTFLIAYRDVQRGHLHFGPDHITRLGWRDQLLPIHHVRTVKWRSATRSIRLYTPRGNLTINLDRFDLPDRVKIIHEIRTRTRQARHFDWPRFCHQHAVRYVNELSFPPPSSPADREPAEGELLITRTRYGAERALVAAIYTVLWAGMITASSTGSFQFSGLLASRELTMQVSAMTFVPILAAWICWAMLVWNYPKAGLIKRKTIRRETKQERKIFTKFGFPVFLIGVFWSFVSYFSFHSVFGYPEDMAVLIAFGTLVALLATGAIINGFSKEDAIKQTDFEPSIKRWQQYETAFARVRRPRTRGARSKDQIVIR